MSNETSIIDLRQFRLEKKKIINCNTTVMSLSKAQGRRRIQLMDDSDSDDVSNSSKKCKKELSTEEKERRLMSLSKIAPEYSTMDMQDGLYHSDWDVSKGLQYLKLHCKKKPNSIVGQKVISDNGYRNGIIKRHSSKHRKKYDSSDSDYDKKKTAVYDSDDSDYEITPQRNKVLHFLNSSSLIVLQDIKSCSERKANAIIELRPYRNWRDVINKFSESKILSGDIMNNCADLISKQNNVANIMEKCKIMVNKLEVAVSKGAGITDQPTILSDGLKLADYQMIGLNWLTVMHNQNMNGILADEMGLGKTIQIIAFLAYLKENNLSDSPHLIIVPSSTLDNWEAELAKWCPSLTVEKYYGSQQERRYMRSRFAKSFEGFDVLLTTYQTVSSQPEERKMFRVSKMHCVIFDEAHMLKNMTSQRYANLITINAKMRILLTGTPLQNNLLELMSLLCFVMPSFFSKKIEDIKSLFQKKSKIDESDVHSFEHTQIDKAKSIMKPFVLRRIKKDVLSNLPTKTDYVKKIAMTADQKDYYKSLVEYCSNANGEIKGSSEIVGCSIMMEMRKLANHPLLRRYYFTDTDVMNISKRLAKTSLYKKGQNNEQYIFEDIAWYSDFQILQLCEKYELDDIVIPKNVITNSGKFNELDNLLPKLKNEGHRVLIFSQFTMMLDIIERYLDIRKFGYLRLDGQTSVNTRQELINNFNDNSELFIFLLSTKAGGVGINLTAADTCIIHDIDFNPYNDKQAEDRCHRMGQTRPVTIYRFISEGTIEEGMLMIAKEKLKLEQEVTGEEGDTKEHKCMVRLLTMALGFDEEKAEQLMSPTKTLSKDAGCSTSKNPNIEILIKDNF